MPVIRARWILCLSVVLFLSLACTSQHRRGPSLVGAADSLGQPALQDPPAGQGPVRFETDPNRLPPVAPAGMVGIAVPVAIEQPLALHQARETTPGWQNIIAVDVPTPSRPRPRGQGYPAQQWLVHGSEQRPDSGGPVARSASGISAPPPQPFAPPLDSTFDSTHFDDNSTLTGSFYIPPDPIGATGKDHVVNVVNTTIRFHDKAGSTTLHSALSAFFATLAPRTATFDPKVIYDQHADRFVVITLEQEDVFFGAPANRSRIYLAVSDDGDPNGDWYLAEIDSLVMISGFPTWADYPGFAVDEEGIYITTNQFGFAAAGGFAGVRLWTIPKGLGSSGLYDGGAATVNLFDPYAGGGIEVTTQPAHIFGAAPAGVGTWLVSYSGLTNQTTGSDFLQFVRVDNPVGPGATSFTQQFLNIGNIEALTAPLPEAPQSGTTETVATNDRRALHAVWRDDNSLWTVATIDPITGPDAGESTAHFWQLDTTTLSNITLVQQGDVSGNDLSADAHTFFPSIAVNSANDVAIGYSISSPTIFPSSAYTTRSAGDAAGTTSGTTLLRAGTDYYIRTFDAPPCNPPTAPSLNRWGDYSGTALDPVDQCFWIYNEHAIARGSATVGGCNGRPNPEQGRWGTAWGRSCICSETFDLTGGAWTQISLACNPGSGDSVEKVFGDDLAGTYDTNWVVFERDAASQSYVKLLEGDPVAVGESYWILSDQAGQIDAQGIDNVVTTTELVADDTDFAGCASSAGRCNMVGHPHKFDVCWADVEIIDGASTLSLSQADPAGACQSANAAANGCVMSRIAHKWTGAGYEPFDGTTPGMQGTLVAWDGFWVSAVKAGAQLRIPATPGSCGAPAAPATSPLTAWTNDLTDDEQPGSGWFIRLSAESDGLVDSANVFGLLPGSKRSYDAHDLEELDPFGNRYLTVVFSKSNWGPKAGNYASDYRALGSRHENWRFEVRASQPGQRVVLRWQGPDHALADSRLYDRTGGRRIELAGGSYEFTMEGTSQAFLWKYAAGQPD